VTSNQLGILQFAEYGKSMDRILRYWIRSRSSACQAVTTNGSIQAVSCDERLPALCSQSAPLSTKEEVDSSEKWRVSVESKNRQSFVGYRDKLAFRFLGIHYAKKPERFEHSRYLNQSVSSNVSAVEYGPTCIQAGCSQCSEDCLLLNIWTPYLPNSSSAGKKAVMVCT
jgi:hypothetical protein